MATEDAKAQQLDPWIVSLFERASTVGFREYAPGDSQACRQGWAMLDASARSRLSGAGWGEVHLDRLANLYAQMTPVEWNIVLLMTSLGRFGTLDPDLTYVWLCAVSDEEGPLTDADTGPLEEYAAAGVMGPYAYAAGMRPEEAMDREADAFTIGALRAVALLHGIVMPVWPLTDGADGGMDASADTGSAMAFPADEPAMDMMDGAEVIDLRTAAPMPRPEEQPATAAMGIPAQATSSEPMSSEPMSSEPMSSEPMTSPAMASPVMLSQEPATGAMPMSRVVPPSLSAPSMSAPLIPGPRTVEAAAVTV